MDAGTNDSMVFGKCPSCQEPFVVGLKQEVPRIQYVLRPVDLEEKKKAFVQAIQESSLDNDRKKAMVETYGNKDIMVDPSAADFMISELRSRYAKIGKPEEPVIEVVKTSKKKTDATQEPQTK